MWCGDDDDDEQDVAQREGRRRERKKKVRPKWGIRKRKGVFSLGDMCARTKGDNSTHTRAVAARIASAASHFLSAGGDSAAASADSVCWTRPLVRAFPLSFLLLALFRACTHML